MKIRSHLWQIPTQTEKNFLHSDNDWKIFLLYKCIKISDLKFDNVETLGSKVPFLSLENPEHLGKSAAFSSIDILRDELFLRQFSNVVKLKVGPVASSYSFLRYCMLSKKPI